MPPLARLIAVLIALAPCAAAAQGAIAFNPATGRYAHDTGADAARTERDALEARGERGCRIVAKATRSKCAALAKSKDFSSQRGWSVGRGDTSSEAEKEAVMACQGKFGGYCESPASVCW